MLLNGYGSMYAYGDQSTQIYETKLKSTLHK